MDATSSSIAEWVSSELSSLDLGDKRRDERARKVLIDMCKQPTSSVCRMSEGAAEAKAAYRFLSNEDVEPADIRQALVSACVERVKQAGVVLAIQDTTSLDFRRRTSLELGPTGGGNGSAGNGLFVHSCIAVSHSGVPLGLLHQIDWARDPEKAGSRHRRKQVPIEQKESFRWIQAQREVGQLVPASVQLIHVADREADIFEMFAEPRGDNEFMLVRAYRERRVTVDEDQKAYTSLLAAAANAPVAGEFDLVLKRGAEHHRPREVRVALRFCELTVKPPTKGVHDPDLQPLRLTAVLAEEKAPPKQYKPLKWLLLTDLDVHDFDTARECVRLYSLRWLIERYHYTLKSGCRIEETQLRSVAALRRLLALYAAVALRLLWMTYSARIDGDQPCSIAFSSLEWRVLFRYFNPQASVPDTPPPLSTVVRWTARLGGFLNRKSDGAPGVQTLWHGLTRLHDIVVGVQLIATEDVGKD